MRIGFAAAVVLLGGCVGTAPGPAADDAPWKGSGDSEVVTAAPDAGGVLSFRNCPTLPEAKVAMPAISGGPDANAVPFKSMVLQCSYALPGRDPQGRAAGISILVFDAQADGREAWEWVLGSDSGTPTVIPDLGDSAFATARDGASEVWVSAGRFGLHLLHTGPREPALAEVSALARAAIAGLARAPR